MLTRILPALLFVGLVCGGLREPLPWFFAAGAIWLAAFSTPAAAAAVSKYWALWLAWAIVSTCLCGQPGKALYGLGRWLTLAAYLGLASVHWREEDSKRWFYVLASAAAVLGIAALVLPGAVDPRTGLVIHPMTGLIPPYYNYTVFVEAAFLGAGLGVLAHRRRPRGRAAWVLLALMAFAFALILKARSRGGLAAVGVAGMACLLRAGKRGWMLAALAALALAVALTPQDLVNHLLKLEMFDWFKRPQIWAAAISVAVDHPIWGVGLDNFEQGFQLHNFPTNWPVRYGFSATRPESEPLGLAAETGWVGLILFLTALVHGLKRESPDKPSAALQRHVEAALPRDIARSSAFQEGGFCAFAAMATQCLTDNMLHLPALAMLFLSSVVCARGQKNAAVPEPAAAPGRGSPPGQGRALSLFGGAVLGLSVWLRWTGDRALRLYEKESDPRQRLELLGKAAGIYPEDFAVREELARAWLRVEPPRPEKALEELRRAARSAPLRALYPLMQAEILWGQSRPRDALELTHRAIALEPNYLNARLLRARLWAETGQRAAARRELKETLARRRSLRDEGGRARRGYESLILGLDEKLLKAALRAAR